MTAPTVTINGISYQAVDFVDFSAKAYRILSDLYEVGETIGLKNLLIEIGAIAPDDWSKYPSGYRKISTQILSTTMAFQAAVGDMRDLQSVIKQKKVTPEQRRYQRGLFRQRFEQVFGKKPPRKKKAKKLAAEEQPPLEYLGDLQV